MKLKLLIGYFLGGMLFGLTTEVAAVARVDNPWRIWINIPECCLRLYYDDELYQTYRVAVGKAETPSPQGDFLIRVKVLDPTWYPGGKRQPVPPGPGNPLGGYWLGLDQKGYGIHGNNQADSVGNPASHGCFRMANTDVAVLFKLVPTGTPVRVTYRTVFGFVGPGQDAYLYCFPDYYHQMDQMQEALLVLRQLAWLYQPHYGALTALLPQIGSVPMSIPRRITVESDGERRDGFVWDHSLFIRVDPQTGATESGLFPGYALVPVVGGIQTQYRLDWDSVGGVLRMETLLPKG
jgi:hypothetical protein